MKKVYQVKEPANAYAIINNLNMGATPLSLPFRWIGESKIIQSLALSTDVYIASGSKIGEKPEWSLQSDISATNYAISARFLDPYDNFQSVSELQIWSSGPSADVGVSNIKRDLNSLPEYDILLNSYYYENWAGKKIYPLYNVDVIQYRMLQNSINGVIGGKINNIQRINIPQIGQLTRNFIRATIFDENTKQK